MKRTTIRNAFAALSVAVVLGSTAAQAAEFDNRQLGHVAPTSESVAGAQLLATGFGNSQLGHFAAKVSNTSTGFTASHDNTEYSHR